MAIHQVIASGTTDDGGNVREFLREVSGMNRVRDPPFAQQKNRHNPLAPQAGSFMRTSLWTTGDGLNGRVREASDELVDEVLKKLLAT